MQRGEVLDAYTALRDVLPPERHAELAALAETALVGAAVLAELDVQRRCAPRDWYLREEIAAVARITRFDSAAPRYQDLLGLLRSLDQGLADLLP